MPNHVTHKLIFDIQHLENVKAGCFIDGSFNFEALIPTPIYVYQGDVSSDDQKDFEENWYSWNVKKWGTKWNCYNTSIGEEKGKAFIKFDTAWSIPYPVIVAFCNKFQIPFEHRYYDEGSNFWGIEKWGEDRFSGKKVKRIEKLKSRLEDKESLRFELKGYEE